MEEANKIINLGLEKEKIKNFCLEKEPSPCVSSCPFHYDVRSFISRVRRGGYNFAYRLFADAVCFPEIVSELCDASCASACPLVHADGAVDLRELERACLAYASNKEPNSYNMPQKSARIAIVGAGPAGLACLVKLTNRKYKVTVFEKSDRIGGSLWKLLPEEVFMCDIELQLKNEKYELLLNREIKELSEIEDDFEAIFIAAGSGSSICRTSAFPAVADAPLPLGTKAYAGGSLVGSSSAVASIAQGIKAASLIEAFVKTGNLKGAEPYSHTKIKINPEQIKGSPAVQPGADGLFSKEGAKAEAKRCIMCRCDFCARSCDLMEYYQKFPKLIEQEVHITIYPGTLDGNGTVSTRLISTCNQCGLCSAVCPENIDVGLFLRESHAAMKEKGAMPWAFHEFWLRDMEHADSEAAAFSYTPTGCEKSRYLFFPGCQSGASKPDYVLKPYAKLLEALPDTSILVGCCGAPAMWAGDKELYAKRRKSLSVEWEKLGRPVLVCSCPTCMEFFREYMPEIKIISLPELLSKKGIVVPIANDAGVAALFDPCASRNFPAMQLTARKLAAAAGFELAPLEYEGKKAKCCSWGGQVEIANPPYAKWVKEKRIAESELPYIAYCTNCRDIFAEAGKPVKHLLDVLFDMGGWNEKPPTWSERHRNREYLKKALLKEYRTAGAKGAAEGEAETKKMKHKLKLEPELAAKLSRVKILEDDILDVIAFCEESGRKLVEPKTGHFIGYREVGHMTFWAEYLPEGSDYRLFNAYGHRMKIELEEVWNGRIQKTDLR